TPPPAHLVLDTPTHSASVRTVPAPVRTTVRPRRLAGTRAGLKPEQDARLTRRASDTRGLENRFDKVRLMAEGTLSVHAGRPRAGRRLEPIRELELSADALAAARTLPNAHRGVRVLLETAGPFGVPDLLAVIGPLDALDRRLAVEVPPLLNQVD